MSVDEDILQAIRGVVGAKGWIDRPEDMAPYLEERRGNYRGRCAVVVRPDSTDQVAAVVSICAEAKVPIVPQGGNTGLVGGAVADGGIVLATGRLNNIRHIDPLDRAITVEAGCILADVQAAAEEAGCLFPLSLGAEGSCQIGGNLSTNAGGVAVMRYGNARDLVLGIEAVLPDGRVYNGLKALRKDNTGYDLKHLFIGAEGTLGIITAAVLKLFPRPPFKETALAAVPTLEKVLELFARAGAAAGDSLTAFEMMSATAAGFAVRHIDGVREHFDKPHPYYALLELSGFGGEMRESLETVLARGLEDGILADAVIAASESQARELWLLRESLSDAQKNEGASIKHDISLPVSKIAEFIAAASAKVEEACPGVRVVAFGHIGDGNIHYNLSRPEGAAGEAFLDNRPRVNRLVHDLACEMGGSFSAEHGIGRLKVDDMGRYKSGVEMDLMRALKKTLDPDNIMNPGKVIEP